MKTMDRKSRVVMEEEKMGGLGKASSTGRGDKKVAVVEEEEEEEVVLPGFRFHPTDEELVGFYLRRKVEKKPLSIEIIKQIDIYKYDPWDLPKVSNVVEGKEWYFFCLRGRKYRNSIRPNRVTGSGFWKATGIDRPIQPSGSASASAHNTHGCIGLKKSLVYYRGSAGKGAKTDWMMHEFRLPSTTNNDDQSPAIQEAEIWTICRIFKRNVTYKKYAQMWKESVSKQNPSEDLSSKTNSFESDAGDEHKIHQEERSANGNYIEEANYGQVFAGQWNYNPTVMQSPLAMPLHNPAANDLYREGNWDELGRMVENMMDPALIYECRYF